MFRKPSQALTTEEQAKRDEYNAMMRTYAKTIVFRAAISIGAVVLAELATSIILNKLENNKDDEESEN